MMKKIDNPIGLKGVSFIEYGAQKSIELEPLFRQFGFLFKAKMHEQNIDLYRQGNIFFILNSQSQSFAQKFSVIHGTCICATGFLVEDASAAFTKAIARGAKAYTGGSGDKLADFLPAIYGIGDSLIYFVDEAGEKKLFSLFSDKKNANPIELKTGAIADQAMNPSAGLLAIDHFTNNVPVGEMQKWCDFYSQIFGFYEARFFDIRGKKTGLISKVMRSPCGTFSVPINEPTEAKSQIQEYLDDYKGSGIQHVAMLTNDIISTVRFLLSQGIQFLSSPPKTYYDAVKTRIPLVTEDVSTLQELGILVDGDHEGYLLQIFTKNLIGPIFFEVIQRKNHHGFGDGNFQALFDAIERDQKERGYLK
ncbi:MAG: 4-hydroxyphenylpyruvate dioxygenase [Pseudobdellovibrionaceae bacterium]